MASLIVRIELSKEAVLVEIERLKSLTRDGGFMAMPDHLMTPGVSLDVYRWYLDQVRSASLAEHPDAERLAQRSRPVRAHAIR
jgi:hypothetical protein